MVSRTVGCCSAAHTDAKVTRFLWFPELCDVGQRLGEEAGGNGPTVEVPCSAAAAVGRVAGQCTGCD